MSNLNGLASQENYAKFHRQWLLLALEEAGKWTGNRDIQILLADVVLASLRREYANRVPSENMAYFIRAQACLIFSITGDNQERLREYAQQHELYDSIPVRYVSSERSGSGEVHREPSVYRTPVENTEGFARGTTNAVRRRRWRREKENRSVEPVPEWKTGEWEDETEAFQPATVMWAEPAPEPQAGRTDGTVRLSADSGSEGGTVSDFIPVQPAAQSVQKSQTAQVAEKPETRMPEVQASGAIHGTDRQDAEAPASQVSAGNAAQATKAAARRRDPDTFYDPDRTQFWIPGSVTETEHVVEEISIPDEEETDPSSPRLSLINTFLFITMVAAFVFMVYESHVIQHYLL